MKTAATIMLSDYAKANGIAADTWQPLAAVVTRILANMDVKP